MVQIIVAERSEPDTQPITVRTYMIRRNIEDYFKLELGRPELLNRMGENIIVFDYIRPPAAAQILDALLTKIRERTARDKGIALTLSPELQEEIISRYAR